MNRRLLLAGLIASGALLGCPRQPVLALHSGRLASTGPQGVGIEITMRVTNDNPYDVKVRNVRASVVIADKYPLPPLQYNPDQWLGAHAQTLVAVPVVLPWHLVAPLVAETAGRQSISYRVRGLADVTAVRLLGIESNDHAIDESATLSRAQLMLAAARGVFPSSLPPVSR